MTDILDSAAVADTTIIQTTTDEVLAERKLRQQAIEAAAYAAESHITDFVDNLLGKDPAGNQITYGHKQIQTDEGRFDVVRKYERQFWTNTTTMMFIPKGEERPTINLIMADGRGDWPADFALYVPNREDPTKVDNIRFNTQVTGQEIEELNRCEQFAATVMEAAETGHLIQ